jgi:deoxyribonuclease-4
MRLGAHESIAGGLVNAFDRGHTATCEAIQIFTKSNRQWKAKPLSEEEVAAWRERQAAEEEAGGIFPVVAHASYLINIASPEEEVWQKSFDALKIEVERCEALGVPFLALHPGSHMKAGEETGLANVARALSQLHAETPGFRSMVCLEGMAGQGTNLGGSTPTRGNGWGFAWIVATCMAPVTTCARPRGTLKRWRRSTGPSDWNDSRPST